MPCLSHVITRHCVCNVSSALRLLYVTAVTHGVPVAISIVKREKSIKVPSCAVSADRIMILLVCDSIVKYEWDSLSLLCEL